MWDQSVWQVRRKPDKIYLHNYWEKLAYRWNYGSWLKKGFGMLHSHDDNGSNEKVKAFRNGWLDEVEASASDFAFTGPFYRYCLCHSKDMDDAIICPVTLQIMKRWAVVDSKQRVLGEASLDLGLVSVPDGLVYLV